MHFAPRARSNSVTLNARVYSGKFRQTHPGRQLSLGVMVIEFVVLDRIDERQS